MTAAPVSNVSDLVTAAAALAVPSLAGLGGAVRWLWKEIKEHNRAFEQRIAKLEAEQEATERHLDACRRGRSFKLMAIELLCQELRHIAPDSWVLDKARDLLAEAKRIDDEDDGRMRT